MSRAATLPALRFGPADERRECQIHFKIAFGNPEAAVRSAECVSQRSGEYFDAYLADCGWYHIGHKGNGHPNQITHQDLKTRKVK